jgi:hypothetical protein
LLATIEERTVVTSRRRIGLIAGAVVGLALALALALSTGLGRRHADAPKLSTPPKAGHTPVAPTRPGLAGDDEAPAPGSKGAEAPTTPRGSIARRAETREEGALPPGAAASDFPAPRAEADEIPEEATAHRRRGGHHHERAASSRHDRGASHRKHGRDVAAAGDRRAAREAYARGNAALLSGNAAEAAAAYAEAVRLAPSEPVGYRGLGLAYEKQGKVQAAISSFVSYLKLSHHARDREVIARRLYHLTHAQP